MLREDVLPYARVARATTDASAGGTGALASDPPEVPAVAVDEEELGAAWLERRIVNLAWEFESLAGETDDASVAEKRSIIAALQGISYRVHFSSPPTEENTRRGREKAAKDRARGARRLPPPR
jgi:hypothetical protein